MTTSTISRSRTDRALTQLSATSRREVLRNPLVLCLSVLFPLCFILMFAFLPSVPSGGGEPISALAFGLPAVLLFAITSLGVLGTASLLTLYRRQGVLALLGTTPLRRSSFLLSLMPIRVAVIAAETVLILGVAALTGTLQIASVPLLLAAVIACAAALLAIGFWLGAISRSPELIGALGGALTPLVLFGSGVLLPLAMMPAPVQKIAEFLPFTYMGDLLRYAISGIPMAHSVWLSFLVIAATALLAFALGARAFRWDKRR